ncbi:MAG: GNAT family protein [Carnobacterium inhibens]|uniref:GNAT family N-acetyltransferase n=1 Tax=Carnobacterium inhibens TaxID=147709 RepID=UPI0033157672
MNKNLTNHKINIYPIKPKDLEVIWKIAYGQKKNSWMNWNGPYFNNPIYEKAAFINQVGEKWIAEDNTWSITYNNEIIGTVSYYYGDGNLNKWLEAGICIYNPEYWNKGISTIALKLWIDHLFENVTNLPHIGFTTWSGNNGMMRVGEKVGMTLEGRIRKVRYWQNQYWDSIKYGILREEWNNL